MFSRVYVEITNRCNMNCSFCHGTSRPPRSMSREEFEAVLSGLSGVTEYLYYHVMGEPLTHKELPDFIRRATEYGYKSAITTNGTLLSRRGDEIISAGVYKVSISLHSFEEGSIESLDGYLDGCFDFAKKASRAGVLTVLRLWNRGYDGGKNEYILNKMKSSIDGEWKWSERGARIRDKLHLEWGDRFIWPDMEALDMGESVFCYGLKDHFGILSDGSVVPCCLDADGAITLGNIFEEDVREILSGDRARAIAEGFKNRRASEELCRKCAYARRFK
ncbi:MAG: radical SAM protein [Clostridia bacterium]|nr:radical SAM protein [Clostridia bacterium]